jgi:LuxR family transcriptional regulator, maltose regulon positive regulatory protein
VRIDYDVERFLDIVDHRADDPEAILEAIDLYRGPYLQFTDSHWCLALRSQLEQQYLKLLHLIASASMEKHLYADALKYYQHILAIDMLDELAHAAVMRCQVALGNRAAAINQYQALRRILDEEYGLEPGNASEVEQLYRHILAES